MIRILQIIASLLVFVVAPIVAADHFAQSGFLNTLMVQQSMSIMGTILAIYIAAAASFLAIVMGHEKEKGKVMFNGTSTELKHNIAFVIAIFGVHFFLLSVTPLPTPDNGTVLLCLKAAKVFAFSIYIYALYELSHVLFGIRDTLNGEDKE